MAMILTCYYRPKPGGFCTRLFRAIQALVDRGHTVHYLAVERFPIDHPNCVFHRFPWPVEYSDTLLFWAFFHLLAPMMLLYIALRYRVTQTFTFGLTYGFLMQAVALFLKVPVVCFLRGDTLFSHELQHRPNWIVALDRWIEGRAVKGVYLIGVSKALLDTIVARHPEYNSDNYCILPNDLPEPIIKDPKQIREPLAIAMAGILEPMKNHAHVINVLKTLPDSPWSLCLYGHGPEKDQLVDLVRQTELEHKVSFMGWVSRHRLWSKSDILLSSSLQEGMPNSILEAISNGVPVLASDIPAHRELLPAEQLLPLNDLEAWRTTLSRVLENPTPLLLHMVQKQTEFAAYLNFDWDESISQIIVDPKFKMAKCLNFHL